jgi:hypothetical protein
VAMVRRKLRPVHLGGAFVCSLDWSLARCWARFVIPPGADPCEFDLRFVRGLDILIMYRPGHNEQHVSAVVEALTANGARVAVRVPTPRVVR